MVAPPEGGFEGNVKAFRDRPLEQPSTDIPGEGICLGDGEPGGLGPDPASRFVGVEVLAPRRADRRATDAALAGSVDTG